jgi:hypothetical protein
VWAWRKARSSQLRPGFDGGLRVVLRRLVETGAEDRVLEVVGHALALQERQVAAGEVARAPGEDARVERDDDRAVAGVLRALHEARGQLVVRRPVELEPARRVAELLRDVLHRGGRGVAQDHRQAQLARGARHRALGVVVHDRRHADRREHHRRGHLGAEHGGAQVALADVHEHARHDPPAVERLAVRTHGDLLPRAARHVSERLV